MKKYVTYGLWACFYVICVCLGMLPRPTDFGAVLCTVMALAFFVPGVLLLYWGYREGDKKTVKTVRLIAICSLTLTLILLVANIASARLSEAAGNVLYVILVLVSAPMTCLGSWAVSLFSWACLLMGSFVKMKNKK